MTPDDRLVAGLRCSTVMVELGAYLDRELPADRRTAVEAHVSACNVCATFGAEFAELIAQVRAQLGEPEPVPDAIAARLRSRVEHEAP